MSKESFVFVFGLILFLTPFLGVPQASKEWIVGMSGVMLMFFGYQLRRQLFLRSVTKGEERKSNAFSESVVTTQTETITVVTDNASSAEPAA